MAVAPPTGSTATGLAGALLIGVIAGLCPVVRAARLMPAEVLTAA
jgi:putative ABC transport system permease protein